MNNLDAKIKAMESYEFEKRPYPHPRSPEALEIIAKRWGTVVGTQMAEAFCGSGESIGANYGRRG